MKTVTITSAAEPWKRTLRTVVTLLIAIATATPWILALIQKQIDPTTGLSTALGQIVVVAGIVTRIAASPVGNYLFGAIGLDSTAVHAVTADVQTLTTEVAPLVAPVADAIKTPSVDTILTAGDTAVAAVAPVQADVAQTVTDATTAAAAVAPAAVNPPFEFPTPAPSPFAVA